MKTLIFILVLLALGCGRQEPLKVPPPAEVYDPSVPVNNECNEGYDITCNPFCKCLPHAENTGNPFSTW